MKKWKLVVFCILIILLLICFFSANQEKEAVYRETVVEKGDLTVGITEDGSIDIGTTDDTFDLDISALIRSDSGSSSESQTSSGQGSLGGGVSSMGGSMSSGMDMFTQIFSYAQQTGGAATTSDNTLTVASVHVSVGQEIQEGDILYTLEEESVAEIAEKLETDVEKAQADLDAANADYRVSRQSAEHTYESSVAYGEYASTEYEETISKLNANVTAKKEAIALVKEELALYQTRLTEVNEEYEMAVHMLEQTEWGLENTDKWNNTYVYVTTVSEHTQAESNYNTLLKEKENLEESIENAEANIAKLERELAEAERALEQGKLSAQQTYDLRILAYDTAQETLDIATAYLDEDITEQEEVLKDAQERWELYSSTIQENAIVAEYDGIVTDVYLEAGDTIKTNDTLVTLYDLEDVTITVTVEEEDMTDIALHGAANVVLTAYPEEVFFAEVTEISDAVTNSSGEVSYSVTVTLSGDVRKLYQGMTGEVTFITRESKDVLYVSNRAITRENGNSYVKIKEENGTIQTVKVVTGFSDGENVEIIEGLTEGDVVLIESKVSD